ncbi:MAG: hypothetical protein AB7D36_03500 [Oscillospiraceae bacterium]
MAKKKKTPKTPPLIQNRRVKNAIIRVVIAAVIALILLYLSGISLFTLLIGAKSVDTRDEMSKSAMQTLTGTVAGVYRETEAGYWTAVTCSDGLISVVFEEKPETGATVTATGFVSILNDSEKQDLFAWYDENGDFAGGETYFDNVSPMYIHDGYGRLFPIVASKVMSACTMLCGVYMLLIYMGISSGKYGENK